MFISLNYDEKFHFEWAVLWLPFSFFSFFSFFSKALLILQMIWHQCKLFSIYRFVKITETGITIHEKF